MDEIIGEMDCRYRADSITMSLLRSAMDNALENVQSSDDPIEFLNETSKFYEFAIIQIDACLKLIKEEPHDQFPETSRKKILTDLIDLKDLFRTRLNDTKCLIIQKDKELTERLQNLKNVEVLPHKKMSMEQMNSDVDILKRTLDHAWKQIHKSEDRPLEKQWRLLMEKEMILITLKGYIHDLKIKLKSSIKSPVSKNKKSNKVDKVGKKDTIIARLMEERRESNLQTMAMDEHYMGLVDECCDEFLGYEIEAKVKEDMFLYVLHEVIKDWTVYEEDKSIKTQLKDEIYKTFFRETINDMRMKLDFELQKIHNKISESCIQNADFEYQNIQNKISESCVQNSTRLEQIKEQVEVVVGLATSIKDEGLVYKKAFTRRCQNLLFAETEVDLLGDQVEALQDLIRQIYYVLAKKSSVLPHDFKMMEILKLFEKELGYEQA